MAIIKQPGQEEAGGVPVVSAGGAGRSRPAAGGVARSTALSGSGGGSSPGFVNITRMLDLNQGQGKNQANAVAAGKDEEGNGINSSFNDLEKGFDDSLDKEKSEAGVGVVGSKPTGNPTTGETTWTGSQPVTTQRPTAVVWNSTGKGPWTADDYADNEKYKNNTFDGPADIAANNQAGYDQTMQHASNFNKDINSLSTSGGLQQQIQSKYGANGSLYGSAFDEQLTRTNGQSQFSDLQNKFSGIAKTLSDRNAASGARSNAVRDAADGVIARDAQGKPILDDQGNVVKTGGAKQYNEAEYGIKKDSVDRDNRLESSGYYDPSTFTTNLQFSGAGTSGGMPNVPITYSEYVRKQQASGKPVMSESEFQRGQQMYGVNPAARTDWSQPNTTKRKTGTIKQG